MAKALSGKSKFQWLEERRAARLYDRGSYESTWRTLGDIIDPFRVRFSLTDNNRGDRRSTRIIRNVAGQAQRRLRAIMASELLSPVSDWYELTTGDPKIDADKQAAIWLREERDAQLSDDDRSNFYTEADLTVGDGIKFGTGALFVEESLETVIHCKALPIGSYAIGVSENDQVNEVSRDFRLNTAQMVEKFTYEKLPRVIRRDYDLKQYNSFWDVAHLVYPNEDWNPQYLLASKRFLECYWCRSVSDVEQKGGVLREGGYDEFPIMVPRWEVAPGDLYGTNCPGITAMDDILELQKLAEERLRLLAYMSRPAVSGPPGIRDGGIDLMPGGVTEEPASTVASARTQPIFEVQAQALVAILDAMKDCTASIREAFYADVVSPMLDDLRAQKDTAAAVYAKQDERNSLMGSVVTRYSDDFHDPYVRRHFGIRWRRGLVKPPPPILQGKSIHVRLLSKMASAQRSVGLSPVIRFGAQMLEMAPAVPGVLDNVDWDEYARTAGRLQGVPPKIIRSPEETAALRQARAKEIARQQAVQQAMQAADTASKLSNVDMNQDTAGSRMLASAGGA